MIVNYDCTVIMIVNYDCKNFTVQATGHHDRMARWERGTLTKWQGTVDKDVDPSLELYFSTHHSGVENWLYINCMVLVIPSVNK